jgi:hypothetical protein
MSSDVYHASQEIAIAGRAFLNSGPSQPPAEAVCRPTLAGSPLAKVATRSRKQFGRCLVRVVLLASSAG